MIQYPCPVCGSDMESDESKAGLIEVCPSCQANVRVPGERVTTPAPVAPTDPAPAEAPPDVPIEAVEPPVSAPEAPVPPASAPEAPPTDDPFAALLGETTGAPANTPAPAAPSDDPLAALAGATGDAAPAPATAVPATATAAPARPATARRKGPLPLAPGAKASMILGLIGFLLFPPLGIFALLKALKAKKALKKLPPEYTGAPYATFGLLLGILSIPMLLVVIAGIVLQFILVDKSTLEAQNGPEDPASQPAEVDKKPVAPTPDRPFNPAPPPDAPDDGTTDPDSTDTPASGGGGSLIPQGSGAGSGGSVPTNEPDAMTE